MVSTKRKADSELVSPPSKRLYTDNNKNVEQASSPSRSGSAPPPWHRREGPRGSSMPRHSTRSPPPRRSSLSPTPSVSASSDPDSDDEDHDALLSRIQLGIAYTRTQQHANVGPLQTTRFQISITTPSRALSLLRRHGTLIYSTSTVEGYELPVPRPDWVKEGDLPGLHDPQWWMGKSAAQVKAGPHAEEGDVKRAAGHIKGMMTRRERKKEMTGREREIEWKLNEGVRRQEEGLRMWGDIGGGEESDGRESDGSSVEEDEMEIIAGERAEEDSEVEIIGHQRAPGIEEESDDEPIEHRRAPPAPRWMPKIEEEESDSDDDVPVRPSRKARWMPRIEEEDSENESSHDVPVTRRTNRRTARWRPIVEDEESDSETEVPLRRDPQYLRFRSQKVC